MDEKNKLPKETLDNKNKEEKPNEKIKPPQFYNLSEGVDPKVYSDKVIKEKESKQNGK